MALATDDGSPFQTRFVVVVAKALSLIVLRTVCGTVRAEDMEDRRPLCNETSVAL